MSSSPGQDLIDAIDAMNRACEQLGIGRPSMIGMSRMTAVHAIEAAIEAAGQKHKIQQIIGGIEVGKVAIKVSRYP
jgi:hypothetical protein